MSSETHCCEEMQSALDGGEAAIEFIKKFREYGIPILDGGSSMLRIHFCPWCGKKLPETLRYRWVEELESLGFEPYDDNIPEKFTDERWYQELKL